MKLSRAGFLKLLTTSPLAAALSPKTQTIPAGPAATGMVPTAFAVCLKPGITTITTGDVVMTIQTTTDGNP
jgi:hypothetical protein